MARGFACGWVSRLWALVLIQAGLQARCPCTASVMPPPNLRVATHGLACWSPVPARNSPASIAQTVQALPSRGEGVSRKEPHGLIDGLGPAPPDHAAVGGMGESLPRWPCPSKPNGGLHEEREQDRAGPASAVSDGSHAACSDLGSTLQRCNLAARANSEHGLPGACSSLTTSSLSAGAREGARAPGERGGGARRRKTRGRPRGDNTPPRPPLGGKRERQRRGDAAGGGGEGPGPLGPSGNSSAGAAGGARLEAVMAEHLAAVQERSPPLAPPLTVDPTADRAVSLVVISERIFVGTHLCLNASFSRRRRTPRSAGT
jgi:hypothetical protein